MVGNRCFNFGTPSCIARGLTRPRNNARIKRDLDMWKKLRVLTSRTINFTALEHPDIEHDEIREAFIATLLLEDSESQCKPFLQLTNVNDNGIHLTSGTEEEHDLDNTIIWTGYDDDNSAVHNINQILYQENDTVDILFLTSHAKTAFNMCSLEPSAKTTVMPIQQPLSARPNPIACNTTSDIQTGGCAEGCKNTPRASPIPAPATLGSTSAHSLTPVYAFFPPETSPLSACSRNGEGILNSKRLSIRHGNNNGAVCMHTSQTNSNCCLHHKEHKACTTKTKSRVNNPTGKQATASEHIIITSEQQLHVPAKASC